MTKVDLQSVSTNTEEQETVRPYNGQNFELRQDFAKLCVICVTTKRLEGRFSMCLPSSHALMQWGHGSFWRYLLLRQTIPFSSSTKGCSNRQAHGDHYVKFVNLPEPGLLICYMGEYIPSVVAVIPPPSMELISVIGESASPLLPSELFLLD